MMQLPTNLDAIVDKVIDTLSMIGLVALAIVALPFLLTFYFAYLLLVMLVVTSWVWIPLSVVGVIVYCCLSLFV